MESHYGGDVTEPDISAQLADLRQAITDHAAMDSRQHDAVSSKIDENAEAARADREAISIKLDSVAEMLSVWNSAKGFLTFMGWIGKFVKFVGVVTLTGGAIWAFIRYGKIP